MQQAPAPYSMNPRFPASSPRRCGYHTTTIVPLGLAVRKVCPSPLLSRFKRGCIGNRKQKRPTVLEIAITSVTRPLLKSGFPSVSLSLFLHTCTYIYMCVRGCACVGACPGPGRRGSNPHCRGRRGSNAGSSVERSSPSPRGKRTRSRSLKDPGQDSLGNLIPCSYPDLQIPSRSLILAAGSGTRSTRRRGWPSRKRKPKSSRPGILIGSEVWSESIVP